MGLLIDTSAMTVWLGLLIGISVCGCSFEPDLGPSGYRVCSDDLSCPGGFACLRGICAPDCIDLDKLAKVEPGEDDDGLWACSKGAYCVAAGVDSGGPARLEVSLSAGDFLVFGADPGLSQPGDLYSRVIIRMSLLAREQDAGRLLTVVLEGELDGKPVNGVYGDIELSGIPENVGEEQAEQEFESNTTFLAVSSDTFGWPIRLKIMPSENGMQPGELAFAARLFMMYACLTGED
jgi:hypothetical protein